MLGKDHMLDHADLHTTDREQPKHRMDGGITAWLQVFGSWILFLNSWFAKWIAHKEQEVNLIGC